MKSGIVVLYKEQDISSQAAVNRVKRLFGVKKAGHTGTLDPLATGILPVLVGRAVKASEYMLTEDKHYRAIMRLGITTDTEDITGNLLTTAESRPSEDEVIRAANEKIGKSLQTPPMYSAIKIGGEKLYDLARRGVTVEREPREINVYSIGVEKIDSRDYRLDVHCSKGTYIRTLCADIGAALGCGAAMAALERTECAGFDLSAAHTLSEIEGMTDEERDGIILPVETVFRELTEVRLPSFFERLARCGVEIYLSKLGLSLPLGERVRLLGADGGFFALGEVREFDTGAAIKPIKQFDID